jgi:hypothetical protein
LASNAIGGTAPTCAATVVGIAHQQIRSATQSVGPSTISARNETTAIGFFIKDLTTKLAKNAKLTSL